MRIIMTGTITRSLHSTRPSSLHSTWKCGASVITRPERDLRAGAGTGDAADQVRWRRVALAARRARTGLYSDNKQLSWANVFILTTSN
jgi:hypothetical protein